MSTVKILSSGNFHLCVISKLLGKPLYATFDTKEQAQSCCCHLGTLLAQGIVPSALLEGTPVVPGATQYTDVRLAHPALQICGVDLTRIDGIDVINALAVISETGADMSRFPTAGHFESWGLMPWHKNYWW